MADQKDPLHEPEKKGRTNEEGIVDREDDEEFDDADEDSDAQDEEEVEA